ncbi:MAG: PIN domain-containing protein [Anaerolineae bacterium]|jgi:predicted nucleic acid-binding protein|nr:PIN domain-containing protein [Anaerolineae bacterium]MDH7473599.1 PIN domain-containing protein [Anaerolineae bacterium]
MSTATADPPVAGIDTSVFLGVLLPDVMIMGDANIAGAERVLQALRDGALLGISTAMLLAEIKWAFTRHGRTGFEIAEQVLLHDFRKTLRIVDVTPRLAILAAELRARYYSRQNDISYNDCLYVAAALEARADFIISSAPHLLQVTDIKTIEPKDFPLQETP